MLIHTCTFQNRPIPVNTYNTCHMYNTYKYIHVSLFTQPAPHTNTYQYRPLHTIHIYTYHTCQYTLIHINTNQYLSIQTIRTICTIHTNTYQCRPLPAHVKCQYTPIHTNACNTYQKQYIPIHSTIHTMPIHANTCHKTNHNTY